jgi:tetratricopeptide (TPR) repeat protein
MNNNVMQFTIAGLKLVGILFAIVAFVTGCATTGTRVTQTNENIEISDNYSVNSEIREEFNKAVTLLKEEKYPEAIMLLRAVTGKIKKFTGPYINLAIAYIKTDELEKAEDNLKKALKLNKSHPAANNELALVYRKTGRFDEARKIYQEVLSQYPSFLPARKNLGVLCDLYLRDLNCALEQYESYLEVMPEDKKVQIWVADLKSRM